MWDPSGSERVTRSSGSLRTRPCQRYPAVYSPRPEPWVSGVTVTWPVCVIFSPVGDTRTPKARTARGRTSSRRKVTAAAILPVTPDLAGVTLSADARARLPVGTGSRDIFHSEEARPGAVRKVSVRAKPFCRQVRPPIGTAPKSE